MVRRSFYITIAVVAMALTVNFQQSYAFSMFARPNIVDANRLYTIDVLRSSSSSSLGEAKSTIDGVNGAEQGAEETVMMKAKETQGDNEAVTVCAAKREVLKNQIMLIASRSDRGQSASKDEKQTVVQLVEELESLNPTKQPASLDDETWSSSSPDSLSPLGTWELVYSSSQLFRSSPFFMAGRAVCKTEDEARQYDWFCDMHRDALAISTIGKVRQIICPDRMISEFEVRVGAVPFLSDFTPFAYSGGWPAKIEGSIVSTATIESVNNGTAWEIFMDTVEIKGSNVPLVRQILDAGVKLQSRSLASFLESTVSGYDTPKPVFRTTYLDESIRVSRDQDDKIFIYCKVSNLFVPTNYEEVMSDMGVAKLLEGFNDAITKFYI